MWHVNTGDKALLALGGFFGGTSFAILVFHFTRKDIQNESPYFWSFVLLVSLGFCLKVVYRPPEGRQ